MSSNKVMLRHGELTRVLNKEEIKQFHHILEKVRLFDAKLNGHQIPSNNN